MLRVRFAAQPLPPEEGARGGGVSPDQRERQAWRGLAWYIESLTKAATFGLVPFEAVFLAYFEDPKTGQTIGEALIPNSRPAGSRCPRVIPVEESAAATSWRSRTASRCRSSASNATTPTTSSSTS